jgi:hypothetical protein
MESIDRGLAVRFTHGTTWRPVEFLRIFEKAARPHSFVVSRGFVQADDDADRSRQKLQGFPSLLTLQLIAELTFLSKYTVDLFIY